MKNYFLATITSFSLCCPLSAQSPFLEMTELYEVYGGDQYMIQEEITQRSHVLQAAHIAKLAGAPEEVIVGLLYHDIGQLVETEDVGEADLLHGTHAERGGAWLRKQGFPAFICEWVENHALAKVVLCEDLADYYEHLSEASKISYAVQKDLYDAECIRLFRQHPRCEDFKAARLCDDLAKIPCFKRASDQCPEENSPPLPDFPAYEEMIQRVLSLQSAPESNPHWREDLHLLHQTARQHRETVEDYLRQHSELDRDLILSIGS